MLETRGLSAGYSGHLVLSGVDLAIRAGTIMVLVGPNGCGKSTLLKTVAGVQPRMAGEILFNGRDMSAFSLRELAQIVAYLPQNRPVPDITALRLVLHGRFPYLDYPRRYKAQDVAAARHAMERVGVLNLADRPVAALSGGMRQKVYLAMALAQDTPVVLLDEPTTFLDVAHQFQTMDHARLLAEEGKTVVMVLHDLTMAMEIASRLAVMAQGRVVCCGEPEKVFASGCLDDVFGVAVRRVQTPGGWRYYYER